MRILARRGSSTGPSTENTVPALIEAFVSGADAVHVDLRLSADGVLVASHDADLTRLAGVPHQVELSSWKNLRSATDRVGVPLARLEWVLAAAGGRPLLLELRSGTPPARTVNALVDRLLCLQEAGLPLDVTVSSADAALIRGFREAIPIPLQVRTALRARPGCLALATLRQAMAGGHDELHLHVSDLLDHPETVELAAARRLALVPWTVNSRRTMHRCADLGVAAILTDVPRVARAALSVRCAAA